MGGRRALRLSDCVKEYVTIEAYRSAIGWKNQGVVDEELYSLSNTGLAKHGSVQNPQIVIRGMMRANSR